MVTKTISKRVNRSLRSGHLAIGPVLFPAASSRKRPAQALRWLIITKKCSGILLTVSMAAQVRTKRIIA